MKLVDYTTQDALVPRLVCADLGGRRNILTTAMAGAGLVRDPVVLVRDVLQRETEGGTALPEGLVLPHSRSTTAPDVCLAVATLARPVLARDSDDQDRPVDVVVLLTGPPGDPRAMLRVLARLAREVRAADLLRRLRGAATPRAMAAVLAGIESDQA